MHHSHELPSNARLCKHPQVAAAVWWGSPHISWHKGQQNRPKGNACCYTYSSKVDPAMEQQLSTADRTLGTPCQHGAAKPDNTSIALP